MLLRVIRFYLCYNFVNWIYKNLIMIVKVEEFSKSDDGSKFIEVLYENGKGLWDGPQRITVHSYKERNFKGFYRYVKL